MDISKFDRIILGIDPGTAVMGFGLIGMEGKKISAIQYGVLYLNKYEDHAIRLQKIFERITSLVEEFLPDEMAIEAPFYGKNVQSMLKLGRAQGVAIAAAISRSVPITEYAPKKIKLAVTGSGNSSKEQVAGMLCRLLNLEHPEDFMLDATDALGVAYCHLNNRSNPSDPKTKDWSAFVKANSDRII